MSTLTHNPQTRNYSLQVIRFEGTATGAKTPNLYAKVRLGDISSSQQTQKIKETSPSWNETFTFSSPDTSSRFNIRVKYEPTSLSRIFKKSNPCIGFINISLEDLLEKCSQSSDGVARLDLHPSLGRPGPSSGTGVLYLHLQRTDVISSVRTDIENTISSIRQRGIARSAMGEKFSAIGDLFTQLGEQSDLYKALWVLCSKIGIFADIVDKLAVAHPYLNAAWQVTSSLFRVAEKKFENDQSIVELVCTASEAFDFACKIEELPDKIQSLQRAITGLLAQSTELCIFVRHYTSTGLPGQILTMVGNSQKIDEFKDSFRKIKEGFLGPLALQTAFTSARMAEKVDTIYLGQELKPDDKAATGRPQCLPGTRGEYLNTIMDWVFSDTEQNILWLYGVAGSGKSTISMTIAEQSLSMSRRGAYLYFEREKSDPNTVIRSIAFWLASFHHSIAKHVSEAVKTNNGIGKAALASQFDKLLLQPLRASAADMIGPIVIILDALDECGPPNARDDLLKLLAERIPELPHNFRFFITSRKERDIEAAFLDRSSVLPVRLDHESLESRNDVATYFRHEMDALFSTDEIKRSIRKNWAWDVNIQLLIDAAGGLFIWASTVVKHLKTSTITAFGKREYITMRCHESFDRMDRMLHFNICDIETSFRCNDCIPDLQSRIEQNIVPELENACVYWVQQLRILQYSPDLLSPLDRFLHYHLLSWLEVLSLIGKVCLAVSALVDAYKWVEGHSTSLESFLRDARKLVIAFDTPISKSMPHIYLSMLPLAWPGSEVAAHYSRAITWPSKVDIVGSRSQRAPPIILRGHTFYVFCVAYSDDGKRIVSGSRDKTIIVWDSESGEVVAGPFKGHTDRVNSVGFSRDGKYIVSGSSDMTIIVWNSESGEIFRGPFVGHTNEVFCVSFSPDGKYVVSSSSDCTVKVWEVESGNVISATFKGHSGTIYTVAYSPDGKQIVSGSDDKTLIVWDALSGEIIKVLEGHTGSALSVMFSPDGKRIVSGSDDNSIRMWGLESGKLVAGPFQGHGAQLLSVAFSLDGKYIFSGSWDDTMKVWDAESGEIISSISGEGVYSVAFSPDGKRVASGLLTGTIQVFDVQADKDARGSFEGHTNGVSSIAYSPDGKHIVSGSLDKTMIVWDVESGKVIAGPFKGHSDQIRCVAYSPDGKYIVSGSEDNTLTVWIAETGEIIFQPFKGHTNWVNSVAFSPDGKRVVSGSFDKTIIVWYVESGTIILGPLQGHSDWVRDVGYSPDGKYIVSGSDDRTMRVWNAETGETVLATLKGHTDVVNSIAYSPDGKYIVSGSGDRTVRVWDLESGEMVAGPFGKHTGWISSVQFSPDGKYVVSGSADKTIIVWDVESDKAILDPLKGHVDAVSSVQFSPDGRHIASGSEDGTIRIWDVENAVASSASVETSTHQSWTLSENGWVLGQEGELLIWIPPDMRASLCLPRNSAVMNRFVTKLHFTERGMGQNWHECFDSQKLLSTE